MGTDRDDEEQVRRPLQRGDLVSWEGLLAVVVGLEGEGEGDARVPEAHVALWYGTPQLSRSTDPADLRPHDVYTVPVEYLEAALAPSVTH